MSRLQKRRETARERRGGREGPAADPLARLDPGEELAAEEAIGLVDEAQGQEVDGLLVNLDLRDERVAKDDYRVDLALVMFAGRAAFKGERGAGVTARAHGRLARPALDPDRGRGQEVEHLLGQRVEHVFELPTQIRGLFGGD